MSGNGLGWLRISLLLVGMPVDPDISGSGSRSLFPK